MTLHWRHVVAVVLLVFAWKGSALRIDWPPEGQDTITVEAPSEAARRWVEPMRGVVGKILVEDRQYLANFYDAMSFVVARDALRDTPIIATTEAFAAFHGGSLQMAVDRKDVGKYPGLAQAIDQTFVNALGAEARPLDEASRERLKQACAALAWALAVNGDG